MTEQASALTERHKRMAARNARLAAATPPMRRVRVMPLNDAIRATIRHPVTGMRFPETGSAEWPLDVFTKRRLREGCVTLADEPQREQQPVRDQPEHHSRSRRGE
jgi:hypothetical protein